MQNPKLSNKFEELCLRNDAKYSDPKYIEGMKKVEEFKTKHAGENLFFGRLGNDWRIFESKFGRKTTLAIGSTMSKAIDTFYEKFPFKK